MNALKDRMAGLSAAEEFFEMLGVAYDPQVLNVKRLHILKAFSQRLAALDLDALEDSALRAVYAATLSEAYGAIAGVEPREAALFKVFSMSKAPAGPAFIPLSAVSR